MDDNRSRLPGFTPRGATATVAVLATLGSLPVFLLSSQAILVAADLGISAGGLGLLASAFFSAASLGTFIASHLPGRDLRRVAAVACASTGGCCLAFAAAQSFLHCALMLVAAGIAHGLVQMTGNMILVGSVPTRSLGLAFGIKQSAGPGAFLLGGLAVPLLSTSAGWRNTCVLAACLVLSYSAYLFTRPPSGPMRTGPAPGPATPAEHTATAPAAVGPSLLLLALGSVSASAAINAMVAFLPSWAFHSGLSVGATGLLVAGASVCCLSVRVVLGAAVDRGRLPSIATIVVLLLSGATGLLVVMIGESVWVITGTLLGVILGWSWPGLALMASVRHHAADGGRTSRGVQTAAFVGGALGPGVFGLLVTATTYVSAWAAAASALFLSAALMAAAGRNRTPGARRSAGAQA